MSIVNLKISVKDTTPEKGEKFYEGTILIQEHECQDISFNFGCKEPFQKVPKIYFAHGDEVVFILQSPLTEAYKKTLNSWQQSLLIFIKDIDELILTLKKTTSVTLANNKTLDLSEDILKALAS